MLIISRKPQESFLIGDDIEVIVLEAQNDRVRLGFVAPKEIQILRKELHDTKAANQEALESVERLKLDNLKNMALSKKEQRND